MIEKKYFETVCGDGMLKLSYAAAAAMIRTAALEIPGISEAMTSDTLSDEWAGSKGVWIAPGSAPDCCRIRIYVLVQLGDPVTTQAAVLQGKIKSTLESTTFLKAETVDICVVGIHF